MAKHCGIGLFILIVATLCTAPAGAATPFAAPASFDLAGSTINVDIRLESKVLGTIDMALDPNPAPLTGNMDIETLDAASGVFSGALTNVTTTTTAEASKLGLELPVTITLNSNTLSGVFLWAKDKVACYPESVTATFTIGDQSWDIPFNGIPLAGTYNNNQLHI